MKIDSHQHYWRYRQEDFPWISEAMPALQRDLLPADSATAMHAAGLTHSIAVQARSMERETDDLLQLARENTQLLGVVGWTDLRSPQLEAQLARWQDEPLLRGFRHIVQDEPDVPALLGDAAFNRGVGLLQARQLSYDVLVFAHQLPDALDFCRRHDKHWLVLDHVAKPDLAHGPEHDVKARAWRDHIHTLAGLPHLMCKLSGLVTETAWAQGKALRAQDRSAILQCFDHALDCFGAERVMFGSDWPVCQLAAPYDTVAAMAQQWADVRLNTTEQEGFWRGNAVRAYGLQVPAANS